MLSFLVLTRIHLIKNEFFFNRAYTACSIYGLFLLCMWTYTLALYVWKYCHDGCPSLHLITKLIQSSKLAKFMKYYFIVIHSQDLQKGQFLRTLKKW